LKFFQVTAILNAQSKRIETNVKEDSARFTQSILNRNQKNEKGELFIPQNPVDDLNLSSDYIKYKKHKNDEDDSSQMLIIETSICLEDRFKIFLLQYVLNEVLGGGLKLYLPDIEWFKGESNCQFYSKYGLCDYSENKNIVNDIIAEKIEYNISQGVRVDIEVKSESKSISLEIYLNENQKNENYDFDQKNKKIIIEIDSFEDLESLFDTSLTFYLDNDSNIFKNPVSEYNFYQIFSSLDLNYLSQDEKIYDGLRIWETSFNKNPVLFAFGIKNYGVLYTKHVLKHHNTMNEKSEMLTKNKQNSITNGGIISPAIKGLDVKLI